MDDRAPRARTAPTSPRRARAAASRPRPSRRRTAGRAARPPRRPRLRTSIPADCTQSTSRGADPAALHDQSPVQEDRAARAAVPTPGKAPGRGLRRRLRVDQPRARRGRPRRLVRAPPRSSVRRARRQLGVLVQQQAIAAAGARHQLGVVLGLAAPPRRARSARCAVPIALRAPPAAEPSAEALSITSTSNRPPGGAGTPSPGKRAGARAPFGVDDADRDDRERSTGVRSRIMLAHARDRRRPARLHAALRPRAVRGAGRGGDSTSSCSPAVSATGRCRPPRATAGSSASIAGRPGAPP